VLQKENKLLGDSYLFSWGDFFGDEGAGQVKLTFC